MRILAALLIVSFAGLVAADDKKDKKKEDKKPAISKDKLLGTWETKMGQVTITGEFKKDGKFTVTQATGEKSMSADGTWELKGDQLTVAYTVQGKEMKNTSTVVTLTDDKLVTDDKDGKQEFTRKKK